MIKDKITPALKKRFLDELRISKETGNERGLVLCLDDKGNLSASESCTGDQCAISYEDLKKVCPTGIVQGDFHTHPYLKQAKKYLKTEKQEIPSDEKIVNYMQRNIAKLHEDKGIKGITINSPSGGDLAHTLLSKYTNQSKGTVCTISDIGDSKLECWTVQEMRKDKMDIYCAKAYSDIGKKSREDDALLIERWIDGIFYREIIDLDI